MYESFQNARETIIQLKEDELKISVPIWVSLPEDAGRNFANDTLGGLAGFRGALPITKRGGRGSRTGFLSFNFLLTV